MTRHETQYVRTTGTALSVLPEPTWHPWCWAMCCSFRKSLSVFPTSNRRRFHISSRQLLFSKSYPHITLRLNGLEIH